MIKSNENGNNLNENGNFSTSDYITKYSCKKCRCNFQYKSDWQRHIKSKKHLRGGNKIGQISENTKNKCKNCGKKYKHLSGLSRHLKTCKKPMTAQEIIEEKIEKNYWIEEKEEKIEKKELEKAKWKIVDLESQLKSKEIGTLKKELLHKDQIIDIYKKQAKEGKNITYNNCNNKNLTVNVYLTEHCKDAMNLTDFVNKIQVQLEDVMFQKDFGAMAGIQNILQKQLGNLDPTDRPIHCTDDKRLQFYVKEDDKWEKDIGNKAAKDIRTEIKNKSIVAMKEWEDANPSFADNPKLADEYNKIIHGILEGYGDKKKFANQIQDVKKRVANMVRIQDAMKNK
jgi:hypothetical protein